MNKFDTVMYAATIQINGTPQDQRMTILDMFSEALGKFFDFLAYNIHRASGIDITSPLFWIMVLLIILILSAIGWKWLSHAFRVRRKKAELRRAEKEKLALEEAQALLDKEKERTKKPRNENKAA